MKYRTKDGDVLDAVCAKHYGDGFDQVEAVLAANPGLAAHGPILASGIIIKLPVFEAATKTRETVRLWD